jgi:hypothetical protein
LNRAPAVELGPRDALESAVPLGWGRILLGVLFLLRTTPILQPLHLAFTTGTFPLLGWPSGEWEGSPIVRGVPAFFVAALCVIRTVATVLFTLGVFTPAAGLFAGVTGYLVLMQHPFALEATLHLLFQGAMLLAIGDAGAVLALRPSPLRNPASSIALIRIFVASIYFWAAFVKLRPDWLDGRTLALFHADGVLSGPLSDFVLATPLGCELIARTIVTTELSLPFLLLWSRTRRFAPFIALAMHAAIEFAAHPDLLGWEMGALLLCLWPPPRPSDSGALAGSMSSGVNDSLLRRQARR